MNILLYGYSEESEELLVATSSAIKSAGHNVMYPDLDSTAYLSISLMRSFDMAMLVGFSSIDSKEVWDEIMILEVASLSKIPFGIIECGDESFVSVACVADTIYKIKENISWVFWFRDFVPTYYSNLSKNAETLKASKIIGVIVEEVIATKVFPNCVQ